MNEDKFKKASLKIIKAISEVETEDIDEMVVKGAILNVVCKMTENEQILNDDLYILDMYAENGMKLNKR